MIISKTTGQDVAEREDAGIIIPLRNERGEKEYQGDGKTPVTMLVAGTYSSRYRRALEASRDQALKQRTVDGDQLEQRSLAVVAACVIGWEGLETDDHTPIPFSKANALDILAACPWIREQVEAAMNDHAAFFRG